MFSMTRVDLEAVNTDYCIEEDGPDAGMVPMDLNYIIIIIVYATNSVCMWCVLMILGSAIVFVILPRPLLIRGQCLTPHKNP